MTPSEQLELAEKLWRAGSNEEEFYFLPSKTRLRKWRDYRCNGSQHTAQNLASTECECEPPSTNEKWTYLVRFLVRSSRGRQRERSKLLTTLVGPAGLEPATRPL
jgi:hypothetical protein